MNIKTRLWINVILSTVIGIIVVSISLVSLQFHYRNDRKEYAATEIVKAVAELEIIVLDYVLHTGERAYKQWQQRHDSLIELLTEESFNKPEEKELSGKIIHNHRRMRVVFLELAACYENRPELDHKNNSAAIELEERLVQLLSENSQLMISAAFQLHHVIGNRSAEHRQRAGLLIVSFLIILMAIIGATSFWINRSVLLPIAKLEGGIRIIDSGNYDYRVGTDSNDEVGQFSRTFDRMTNNLKATTVSRDLLIEEITERKRVEKEREKLISDLQAAVAEIKTLSGIIPICAWCKKIRDDKGYWEQVEVYIRDHTEAEFSHGLCPECAAKMGKEFNEMR